MRFLSGASAFWDKTLQVALEARNPRCDLGYTRMLQMLICACLWITFLQSLDPANRFGPAHAGSGGEERFTGIPSVSGQDSCAARTEAEALESISRSVMEFWSETSELAAYLKSMQKLSFGLKLVCKLPI